MIKKVKLVAFNGIKMCFDALKYESRSMMITVIMTMMAMMRIIMIMMKVLDFSTHQQPLASNQIGFWKEFTPPHYVSGG